MEDPGATIPIEREAIREMAPRFERAINGTYDPSSDEFVPPDERTRSHIRDHTFDFMDAMRLHVSRHNSEAGLVIHGYAQWFDEKAQPARREDGLEVVAKRLGLLIEKGLDHVDETPDPIEAGISDSGVPHVFFPYPSAAFKTPSA